MNKFEADFRQALVEDDPGEYELPVGANGIAEMSHKDIDRIVRIAAASFENVTELRNGWHSHLLNALEQIAKIDHNRKPTITWRDLAIEAIDIAKAAIAKAKGETQ